MSSCWTRPTVANDERPRPSYIVTSAFIRRDGDILLVLQNGEGAEPFCTLPGGTAEEGELLHEALAREVPARSRKRPD